MRRDFRIRGPATACAAFLFLAGAASSAELAGSEWGFPGEELAFVQFGAEGRIAGKAFCNQFTGAYEAGESGSFSAGPLAVTRMACDGLLMDQERDFLERLQKSKSYVRDETRLELRDEAGETLLELTQRDAD